MADIGKSGSVHVVAKRKVNGEWVDIDIDDIDWENINEIHVKGKYHYVRVSEQQRGEKDEYSNMDNSNL